MPARTRLRENRVAVYGSVSYVTGPPANFSSLEGMHERCEDVTGNYPKNNPLVIIKQSQATGRINGVVGAGGTAPRTHNNVPFLSSWTMPITPPSGFLPPINSSYIANAMTTTMARTNPQASSVDLPAFLAEAKDLPSLTREVGKGLYEAARHGLRFLKYETLARLPQIIKANGEAYLHALAKGNITYRFAVAPTLGDATKMVLFVKESQRRLDELRALRDKKEMRRSCSLGSGSVNTETSGSLSTRTGSVISGLTRTTYSYKDWASIRWKANGATTIPKDERGLRNYAITSTFGLRSQSLLESAWELMPWSWLIDYFGNIGDYLKATNNSESCYASDMCLMRRITNIRTYHPTSVPDGLTVSGKPFSMYEEKRRVVINNPIAMPLMDIPVLSSGQWSILGSLSVLRSTRPKDYRDLRRKSFYVR